MHCKRGGAWFMGLLGVSSVLAACPQAPAGPRDIEANTY